MRLLLRIVNSNNDIDRNNVNDKSNDKDNNDIDLFHNSTR